MKHDPEDKFCICPTCITTREIEKTVAQQSKAARRELAARFIEAALTRPLSAAETAERLVGISLEMADLLIERTPL